MLRYKTIIIVAFFIMKFTNLFKKFAQPVFQKVQKVTGFSDFTERRMNTFFKTHHLAELQKIVAPFQTEIPLHVVKKADGDRLLFGIEPIEGITFERNNSLPDPGTLDTYSLFFFLNDGISNKKAIMPPDFSNESHPHSLATESTDYARQGIIINKRFNYEIEPRDWLTLVEAKFADDFKNEFDSNVKDFFKSIFGKNVV